MKPREKNFIRFILGFPCFWLSGLLLAARGILQHRKPFMSIHFRQSYTSHSLKLFPTRKNVLVLRSFLEEACLQFHIYISLNFLLRPKAVFSGNIYRVPTGTGKPGIPGKMRQLFPVREKSGNFEWVREKSGKTVIHKLKFNQSRIKYY